MNGPSDRGRRSRAIWRLIALFIAACLVWVGRDWWLGQQYQRALAEIKSAIAAKRWAVASTRLATLLAWRPGSDEAAFLLGACELERGQKQAALDAWSRVAPGSAFSERAVVERVRVSYDDGRLASAEKTVNDIARDPRYETTAVRVLLVPIYRHVGRVDDALRLVEDRWEYLNQTGEGSSERAIKMLRLHIELTARMTPVKDVRANIRSPRGDGASERPELKHGVAAEPADRSSLLRPAWSGQKDGRPVETAQFLRKQAEVEERAVRYQQLYQRNQFVRDAAAIARLAQQLGRDFEARAFLALAIAEDSERDDLRRGFAW